MRIDHKLLTIYNHYLSPEVGWSVYKKSCWLSDDSRSMGIHIMAGKGSGKSRLMGRMIAWQDFIRGLPQVLFDPHGSTIDNFIDKLIRLPQEIQPLLWRRVRYLDMSGHLDCIFPFPLYYSSGNESLYAISQRYLDVVRKIDPFLQTASVEGWNALWRTGTYIGMILAALNLQISEAESILLHPEYWRETLKGLTHHHTGIQPAIEFVLEMEKMNDRVRFRRTESFFNKTALFTLDPSMKAMFGASKPYIDWNQVINKRMTILLDFRHDNDLERRRFKMVWAFNYFMDFIRKRGAGRHIPVGLIIDELTSLFSIQTLTSEILGSELDELINVIARNYSVWLTIAHQEMFQINERIMKSLMTMGTQILGSTTDSFSAKYLADLYFHYQPYLVKKYENVWGSVMGNPEVLEQRPVEFTVDEQLLLHSYKFTGLGRYQFYAKTSMGEGNNYGSLHPISIERFDQNVFPDTHLIQEARELLSEKYGIKQELLLKEIEDRNPNQDVKQPLFKENHRNPLPSKKEELPFWS